MVSRARILLADDHVLLLDAFKSLLEPTFQVVGAVSNGRALMGAAEKLKPDVIVADINMPQLNGLDALEGLKKQNPAAKLIFLTVNEDLETASEAIRRGACGYILKNAATSELFKALQTVLAGRIYITPSVSTEPTGVFVARAKSVTTTHALTLRQREVLQLLAEGRSMKEAADALKVTARTIAFHKYAMMEQLGLKTTAELIRHASELGLVTVQSHPAARPSRRPAC